MVDVLPCLVISAASVCLTVDSVAYGGRITLSSDLSSICLSHGGQRMVDVLPCLVISAASVCLTVDSVWWTYYPV